MSELGPQDGPRLSRLWVGTEMLHEARVGFYDGGFISLEQERTCWKYGGGSLLEWWLV